MIPIEQTGLPKTYCCLCGRGIWENVDITKEIGCGRCIQAGLGYTIVVGKGSEGLRAVLSDDKAQTKGRGRAKQKWGIKCSCGCHHGEEYCPVCGRER